ncbi:Zinc finger C2H2-type protein [Lasiodiplodia theobromae]|uniref:C2H2 type master regulator of conidiophore development brlA n=1 Tax=Lasiodiplodia theobromae TaxID=45133 RepID=A0A5N5DIT8_9PEZI|nr:Zinc finger C2H2-type protein [Lasiodiplodia theobromae]KAB2576834.1 Zinc finger protein [Lasiodiplodia theobromae]KAF4534572.1 Zinc finger C2H2-type protein [Lasiodiplodia theobromae]
MSSFHRRREETEGQPTQAWNNLAGLNQSFAAHDLPSDQHSLFTIESFDYDVDQSVCSWDNNNHTFVTPPTSTGSHSNAGDYCSTTSNQFYPSTDDAWGCNRAINEYDINRDGPDPVAFDPQLDFVDGFSYVEPVSQPSYIDPTAFSGDVMDMGSCEPVLDVRPEPPKITIEDTGNMGSWLNSMYTPGLGTTDNTIPPRPGPSSMSAMALDVTYRPRELADDQVSESSVNTSHTSHSCRTCSKNFGNKDDLRRHQRYHDPKKHTCRICGKGFVHPKDLRRHKPTHIANRPQRPCPVDGCTTATGRPDNLKRHIQNKHPEFDIDAWTAAR